MPDSKTVGKKIANLKTTSNKQASERKIRQLKQTIKLKDNPQLYTFANISLSFKQKPDYTLELNEFKFLLATAIQTVHGNIANEPDVLKFDSLEPQHYTAIIRFKTCHYTRVVTSLLLFNQWKERDCKFELDKLAQSPCFLSLY